MMRTGISGMNAQSVRLATVADNIANSGTNGYKKASVEFSSLVAPNTGSSYVSGGTHLSVRYSMAPGNLQYTTSVNDLAVDGSGFMVVQDQAGKMLLTRAGSFIPDGNGNLLNAAGLYLMGQSFALGEPGTTTTFGDYERVTIPTTGLERVPSTAGSIASNLPFTSLPVAGHRPSTFPPTDIQVQKGMENGSIYKSGLTAIGNAGEPIRLDVYFTRTSVKDPSGVTVNPNSPLIAGYGLSPLPLPYTVAHPNSSTTSSYWAAPTNIAGGASESFSFPGFSGLEWGAGDTTSFTVSINGAPISVTGTFDGGSWSFVPDNAAAIPGGVSFSYSTAGGNLEIAVTNSTGAPITAGVGNFISREFHTERQSTFPDFGRYHWEEGDTVSFDVDISGTAHRVTGVRSSGAWGFAPDDPATFPAGIDLVVDASGVNLDITISNNTGGAVDGGLSNFTSTTLALADKWEMTVYHQPDASHSGFPYSEPPLTTVVLEFDRETGSLAASSPTSLDLDLTPYNGGNVHVDISGMRQLATDYMPLAAEMNGSRPSAIDRVVIDNDGIVSVQYANGAMTKLYRLDLAYVQSPGHLTVLPGNVFQESLGSGQVNFGKPNEISLGAIKSGALEASNVDIAEELTLMIESQRNYTANSKVFQTGGDLMDVLVNLKR